MCQIERHKMRRLHVVSETEIHSLLLQPKLAKATMEREETIDCE
jgi:hypothetical protein